MPKKYIEYHTDCRSTRLLVCCFYFFSHIFFKIWNPKISNYAYYDSIENQGKINNTRLESGIISGNFSIKFIR